MFLKLHSIIALLFLLLLTACENKENKREFKHKKTNVILISIDTLRPDHMGAYGYNRNTTPFIDKLVKNAIILEMFTDSGIGTEILLWGKVA